MRQLRELPDSESSQALLDALSASGIEVISQESQRGTFAVWVVDEAQLPRADELTRAWLDEGKRDLYQGMVSKGRAARELNARIEQRRHLQRKLLAERMAQLTRRRPTPLSWGIIGFCVAVHVALFVLGKLGHSREGMLAALYIVDPRVPVPVQSLSLFGTSLRWLALPLQEPWRLLTPAVVHFNVIHLIFNLLCLRDLGRVIEMVHGARYLMTFVLVSAALSNIFQYEIAGNPHFGGMSGVVYGLLGVVWLRGKLDSRAVYGLSRGTVQLMLIWLALGFFPHFGVASFAHLGGLMVGAAWAAVASRRG